LIVGSKGDFIGADLHGGHGTPFVCGSDGLKAGWM
jgi:hypothetical protein